LVESSNFDNDKAYEIGASARVREPWAT